MTKGGKIFYDSSEFSLAMQSLQTNWQIIREELKNVLPDETNVLAVGRGRHDWGSGAKRLVEELETQAGWIHGWQAGVEFGQEPNREWLNYPLVFNDRPIAANAACCPQTVEFLRKCGQINTAGFSLMRPGSRIHPHTDTTGPQYGSMAYHLGLIVPGTPPDSCVLSVGPDEKAVEADGQALFFDATWEHWACNDSATDRTVLYVDFDLSPNHAPHLSQLSDDDDDDEDQS